MKTPRVGSLAKAWTEVSTPERTRKVPSSESEKARIASRMVQLFSVSRFSTTIAECSSAVPASQGMKRGVLDRVPEPPAAPAELVVGPVAAQRDADGEHDPGGQRPGPDPARPGGVDPALDQRGDGEGVGHREADIAEVEHRRVEGEARVLQDRVESRWPSAGAVAEAQERVRGEQHEGEEADRRSAPARDSTRARNASGRLAPNGGHGRAEQRQDPDPQHQRALVVAPGAADLVDQRLLRVPSSRTTLRTEKSERDVRPDQRGEGERDGARTAPAPPGPRRRSGPGRAARRPTGQDLLDQRQAQGQHQRVMAELDDHRAEASWPDFCQ